MNCIKSVEPFDLIIFGGTGDLAIRKLIPSLWHLSRSGQFPAASRVIAVGRSAMDIQEYLELIRPSGASGYKGWHEFASRISSVDLDAADYASWYALRDVLTGREEVTRAVYLATPSLMFGPIARGIVETGLKTKDMRIVLEKPLGHDFESARDINDQVGECFAENEIFRIDHYLGKETVQNLLALRFGNSIFEPLWRREVIDHVQITVAEELGVGNRIDFYDQTGALRDMVQNHLMQLVCLVAMEPPTSYEDDAVRDEKIKVLRALRPINASDVCQNTVRGQYVAGAAAGALVDSYSGELGAVSQTETFVALKLEIDNWRWSGVPFFLRTGKRMPGKHSEIVIQFKPVPHSIFGMPESQPNRLSIMLQPNEGVKLSMVAKEPGLLDFGLKPVSLDLSFEQTFGIDYPDAYERLLVDMLRGNPALFMRRDEIEVAWEWIDRILDGWREKGQRLDHYPAGTWGPVSASLMLDRSHRSWIPE